MHIINRCFKRTTLQLTKQQTTTRSSQQRCSMKKSVLGNSTKFTRKHLYQSLFVNKVAGLRPATLLKKRLWHRCFPLNFVKFLRAPFYIEHVCTTASFSLHKIHYFLTHFMQLGIDSSLDTNFSWKTQQTSLSLSLYLCFLNYLF